MQIKTIFTYFSLINLLSPDQFVDIQYVKLMTEVLKIMKKYKIYSNKGS